MELRQLKYFATLAKHLSFSKAAGQLFITQGTLSQQIQQLEQELGRELFTRSSRKVRLSPAGEQLLPLAQKMLQDAQHCSDLMRDLDGTINGTLRVGVSFCFDKYIVSTIRDFHHRYPGVRICVEKKQPSQLLRMLRDEEIDLALAFRPNDNYFDLDMEELFVTKPMAIMKCDHPLAGKDIVRFSDLSKYRIIIPGTSLNTRYSFDHFVKVDTSELNICMEIDDIDLLINVVQNTGILAVVPPFGLNLKAHSLIARPIDGLDTPMPCCAHTLKRATAKASRDAFVEVLRENVKYCL